MAPGEHPSAPKVEDFFVDVGLPGEQVQAQVEIGDFVTLDRPAERVGDTIVGKCMDDRAGVFVMIEALRALRSHEVEIVAVATVQEEVGLHQRLHHFRRRAGHRDRAGRHPLHGHSRRGRARSHHPSG